LDNAVDRFDRSLGDAALEVINDTLPALLEGLSQFAERNQQPTTEDVYLLGTYLKGVLPKVTPV
jgi:hypothetical protein